jgi:hypothetical protein
LASLLESKYQVRRPKYWTGIRGRAWHGTHQLNRETEAKTMAMSNEEVWAKVRSQKDLNPVMYGNVDFACLPERFAANANDETDLRDSQLRARLISDADKVDKLRAFTLLGDTVADRYAALLPQQGLRRLMEMLVQACDQGIEAVEGRPSELVDFIRDMERIPEWLDMQLVEEGARQNRIMAANFAPWAVRGLFIGTFMNKYSALPMAMTGTLSNETAARRVRETATFFTSTVMPKALRRDGQGFKSAALVRLMHSMVRFNALTRGPSWNIGVYGIPIPQVDQMPAGLISIFMLSRRVLASGRNTFTRPERALVELSRYRCYLLGLPEDLLPDTPQGIVDILSLRNGTLRRGFDDDTCGALVRATMNAFLPARSSYRNRLANLFEKSFAKTVFVRNYLGGDYAKAASLGVHVSGTDKVRAGVVAASVASGMLVHSIAAKLPLFASLADRRLVGRLERLLKSYGHAEYKSDASQYRGTAAEGAGQMGAAVRER